MKLCMLMIVAWLAPVMALAATDVEIGADLDRSISKIFSESAVPGAVVIMVREGEIAYAGAFGEGVSVEGSAFRVASLTKSFTALLAISMAEEGLLDLDTDISTYLGDETPDLPFGPVTMRQLLAHSSGMDATDIGDSARKPEDVLTLQQVVQSALPPQRNAPGALYRYANYGYVLAGRVLEKVGGAPYDALMAERVLQPLGLSASGFDIDELPAGVSLLPGHTASGKSIDTGFTNVAPADGLITTGADMARYLQYQAGSLDIAALPPRQALHGVGFTHTDSALQQGLGWEVRRWSGKAAFTHTGGLAGYTSFMAVVPEDEVGIFIALNARASSVRGDILGVFFDKFYPSLDRADRAQVEQTATPLSDVRDFAGTYRSLNHPMGFEAFAVKLGLFGGSITVAAEGDALTINGRSYTEIEPAIFARPFGDGGLVVFRFEKDERGKMMAYAGRDAYRRLGAIERPSLLTSILLLGVVAGVRRGLIIPLVRRVRRKPTANPVLTFAALSYVLASATTMSLLSAGLDFGVPLALRGALLFNVVPGLLALLSLVLVVRSVGSGWLKAAPDAAVALVLLLANAVVFSVGLSGFVV